MRTLLIIFFLSLLASCEKSELLILSSTNNSLKSKLDISVHNTFLKYQTELNSVGISIGIFKNDSAFFYGYGETRKGNNTVPSRLTYFEIGSVTKTFTAIAILQMLKENGETINQPIRKYLPDNLPTLQRDGVEVTFKHLLTHSSGLPYFPDNFGLNLYGSNIANAFKNYHRNDLYTCIKNVRLNFLPETKFEYSNTGMGLLGTILELNYNKSYDEVIREKIFSPLGFNYAKVNMNETNLNDWAIGYNSNGKETKYWESLGALNGAGVIKSNMVDLLNYGVANINIPNGSIGDAIIDSHAVSYLPFDNREYFKINGRLGWFQLIHIGLPNESFVWHNGGTGGFNTDLFVNKNHKTVLGIFFNKDGDTPGRQKFMEDLLKIINQ
jgi:CubicO group peptidase (beta-lactamase class C family)